MDVDSHLASLSVLPVFGPCHLCSVVHNHLTEVQKIIQQAKDARPSLSPNFRTTPICSVPTPIGNQNLTIDDIELCYKEDHPQWDQGGECFPAGPLYFDKLANKTPYARATDLELSLDAANKKIISILNVPFDRLTESDSDIKEKCWQSIIYSIQPMIKSLSLTNNKAIEGVRKELKNQMQGRLTELKDPSKVIGTLVKLQESAMNMIIKKSSDWINYAERVGQMGEISSHRSVYLVMRNIPSIIVQGYRLTKSLAGPLNNVDIIINSGNDAEMDLMDCYTNGDKVVIIFGQVKVLMEAKDPTSFQTKLQDKIKYSLKQTRKDIQGFLLINPDLTLADLNRLKFKTLSFLPATENKHGICSSCSQYIVFREDINPDLPVCDSLANQLDRDIKQQSKSFDKSSLRQKLLLGNIEPPTTSSLNLLLQISSRLVGLGSLFPMKTFSQYQKKKEKQMEKLKTEVKCHLEEALFLGPDQRAGLATFRFAAVGFFGSGKTSVMEVACRRVVEDSTKFPKPKILFITWHSGEELKQRFEEKFSELTLNNTHLRKGSLEVMDIEQACSRYNMSSPAWSWLSFFVPWYRTTKVQYLNKLCEKIQQTHIEYSHHFLAVDEIPCNSDSDGFNFLWRSPSGDWTGLKPNDVHLMMALKPTSDNTSGLLKQMYAYLSSKDQSITVRFPPEMEKLELSRTYRTTQNISPLFRTVLHELHKHSFDGPSTLSNRVSCFPTPGHEISGELPELLILPGCGCMFYCKRPLAHLLTEHKNKIIQLIRRIQIKLQEAEVTVIISTHENLPECANWLQGELANEGLTGVQVKMLEQCRGVEYPVLVTITEGDTIGEEGSVLLDIWTRVTSSLFIIHKEGGGDMFSKALQVAMKQDQAVRAVEQERIAYCSWPRCRLRCLNAGVCGCVCLALTGFSVYLFNGGATLYSIICLCGSLGFVPRFFNWLYLSQFRGLRIKDMWCRASKKKSLC